MKINLIKKSYFAVFTVLIFMLSTCSDRNNNDPVNSNEGTDYIYIQEGKKIYNQNPYLTDEYLENRKADGKYTYFVIDTLYIKNAVKLIYKKDWLQLDMITSEKELDEIDFEVVSPWELLSKDNVYLVGLGGPRHPFLADYNTLELPEHDFDREGYDLTENYIVIPLLQEEFMFLIIDEATYLMTNAVEGFSAPITAHIIGLPLKMAYPLNED